MQHTCSTCEASAAPVDRLEAAVVKGSPWPAAGAAAADAGSPAAGAGVVAAAGVAAVGAAAAGALHEHSHQVRAQACSLHVCPSCMLGWQSSRLCMVWTCPRGYVFALQPTWQPPRQARRLAYLQRSRSQGPASNCTHQFVSIPQRCQ